MATKEIQTNSSVMPIDWDSIETDFNFANETICGWEVDTKYKKIWYIQLQLARELLSVCNKHKLICVAGCGTLLGAIRHKGFIPWDNDMDFFMPRIDYDILCEKYADEFESPFFFQTPQREKRWYRGHACLRDSRTTCVSYLDEENKECNLGIYIDIFPMDGEPNPNHKFETWFFRNYIRYLNALCQCLAYGDRYLAKQGKIKRMFMKVSSAIYSLFGDIKSADKYFHSICSRYSKDKKNRVRILSFEYIVGGRVDFSYDYKEIFTTSLRPFENIQIPVTDYYDRCLSLQYGDYMKFPPINKRKNDEEYINPDMPYFEYQRS